MPHTLAQNAGKGGESATVSIEADRLPALNIPRAGHQLFIVNGEPTVVGGHSTNFKPTATAEYFKDGQWHLLTGNMVFNGSAIETLTISDGDTPLAIGESGSVVGTCLTFDGLKTVYVGRDISLSDYCQEWIGRSTFANASTITDVTYGPKVTMIHPGEFFRNKAIQRVTFLMDEIEIPDEAFHEAEGLTTVVLPERVTAIGEQAFRTVPSLTSLTLPPTVNKIGNNAFYGCKAIKQLTIPATATSIGE